MSELDLDLKMQVRRLLWAWGQTTRVDVELRAVVDAAGSGDSATETFTDIDVLGFEFSPLAVSATVADCKTSQKRAIERVFWLRGLADYFGSASALLVREKDVPRGARTLANRLDIAVVVRKDLAHLVATAPHGAALGDGPLSCLFDPDSVSSYRQKLHGCDKRLQPLVDYLEFDYWLYEEHRNLQRAVAHLNQVSHVLQPGNPMHVSLLLSCTWLYTISVGHALRHLRRTHAAEHVPVLQAYLFGGQGALQEKVRLSAVLRETTGRAPAGEPLEDVLPPYFDRLAELITRLALKQHLLIDIARYAEYLAEAVALKPPSGTARAAFGDEYNEVAAKFVRDIVSLLVHTAGLPRQFEVRVGELLS